MACSDFPHWESFSYAWQPHLFLNRFDEVCHYSFDKDGPQPGTNHFTQLVWKGSTELGIGKASNKQSSGDICTFIVARYKPQGNIDNDDHAYIKNIEKGSFDVRYCSNIKRAGLDGGYGFKRFQSTWYCQYYHSETLSNRQLWFALAGHQNQPDFITPKTMLLGTARILRRSTRFRARRWTPREPWIWVMTRFLRKYIGMRSASAQSKEYNNSNNSND